MNTTLTRTILSALALVSSIATAADFYVAPTGNDSNPGPQERPWKSLAAVSGRAFAPGDSCCWRRWPQSMPLQAEDFNVNTPF